MKRFWNWMLASADNRMYVFIVATLFVLAFAAGVGGFRLVDWWVNS